MNTLLDPGYQIPTQRVRRSSIMDSRDKRNCTNYIAVYVEERDRGGGGGGRKFCLFSRIVFSSFLTFHTMSLIWGF